MSALLQEKSFILRRRWGAVFYPRPEITPERLCLTCWEFEVTEPSAILETEGPRFQPKGFMAIRTHGSSLGKILRGLACEGGGRTRAEGHTYFAPWALWKGSRSQPGSQLFHVFVASGGPSAGRLCQCPPQGPGARGPVCLCHRRLDVCPSWESMLIAYGMNKS